MKTVQEAFPDVYDGSVYAVLRRLLAEGYTETFMGETSGGPPRKYYRLTPVGRKRLEDALSEWDKLIKAVSQIGLPVRAK